jgi:hypothetical protein
MVTPKSTTPMPKKPAAPKEGEKDSAAAAAPKAAAPPVVPPEPKPQTKSKKVGKLPKKDKHRLPRRQKKAQQKALAAEKA